ncbi:hypothetical protein EON63_20960, partial [archaeon]
KDESFVRGWLGRMLFSGEESQKKSNVLTLLPTPVYLYALSPGDVYDMNYIHTNQLGEVLAGDGWKNMVTGEGTYHLRMELQRVSPINHQHRTVSLKLSLLSLQYACIYTETQQVAVKDTGGVFVFEGPMADPKKPTDQVCVCVCVYVCFCVYGLCLPWVEYVYVYVCV